MTQLNDIPSQREISNELLLRTFDDSDTHVLFSLTDKNRAYLRKWLPWLDNCTKEEDTLQYINTNKEARLQNKSLVFGIFYKGMIAGVVGFNTVDLTAQNAEIGYWIGEEFQGFGLITKCCAELIKIGFNELGLQEIRICCAAENTKSRAVPIRLGFTEDSILPENENLYGTFVDRVVYKLLKLNH
ncbi:acetyltransferase (GNAT) domain-containing protein [Ditylenchus destructor]|uniref:Acetyltransferase (GNAT) domain-containing protein n=1 Tax=Ditylenchus destructor TaxID=166010 RepID=A0AAD4NI05_9BILA|nr:acetyltransferase (GNAT) domain-containing protein [Ditylenchus destructor]